MNMRTYFLGLIFSLGVLAAHAELSSDTSVVPPPTAPFVNEPAAGTKWRIILKPAATTGTASSTSTARPSGIASSNTAGGTAHGVSAPHAKRPGIIECQRGASATHIAIRDTQGDILSEGFVLGGRVLRKNPEAGSVSVLPSDEKNFASPFYVQGYQGTEWISLETYRGIEKVGKETCYKFVKPALSVSDPAHGFSHPELTAWIQVEAKIPILIRIGDINYYFSTIESATTDINMPADIHTKAERLTKEQKALDLMRQK